MKPPLTTSQLRAAWGPPCTFAKAPFTFWTGATVTVDRRTLQACQALDDCFRAFNYRPTPPDVGAYVCRAITGGTGYSLHAYGIAIDVNWQDNPYSAANVLVTDMPPAMIGRIVGLRTRNGAPVWGWGGAYRSIKDAMHFEIVCTPADLATGIAGTTTTAPIGGFGTMTDEEILAEFVRADERAKAREAAMVDQIVDQVVARLMGSPGKPAGLLAAIRRCKAKVVEVAEAVGADLTDGGV